MRNQSNLKEWRKRQQPRYYAKKKAKETEEDRKEKSEYNKKYWRDVRKYRETNVPSQRWKIFKKGAKNRNKEMTLTYNQFVEISKQSCYLCGEEVEGELRGIDRVDND